MAASTLDFVNSVIQSNVKAPVVGPEGDVSEEDTSRAALESAMKSLQQRYENPNWFNVAAGFFKPQLGGFAASLGSASEALGKWQEQQRENELPIAAMRAQLGSANKQIANKRSAYTLFQNATKNGFDKMPTEDLLALQSKMVQMGSPELAKTIGDYTTGTQAATSTERNAIATEWAMIEAALSKERISEDEYNTRAMDLRRRADLLNAKNIPRVKGIDVSGKNTAPPELLSLTAPPYSVSGTATEAAAAAPAAAKVAEAPAAAAKVAVAAVPAAAVPAAAKVAEAVGPKETFFLKNGNPATEDVLALEKAGIPVISNIRTQKEQDALKHHQVDGKWFTKENRPVAEDSLHLTGDAIDLSSKIKLTDDQKKLLAEKGFKQTGGPNDTNHWSRPRTVAAPSAAAAAAPAAAAAAPAAAAAAPAAAAPAVDEEAKRTAAIATLRQVPAVTSGLVLPVLPRGATENDKVRYNADKDRVIAQAANLEKVPTLQLQNYQTLQTAVPAIRNTFSSLLNDDPKKSLGILNNPALTGEVNTVLNQVRNAGVGAAMADQGIGISFNPGVGINLNIPVRSALKAGLSPSQMLLQDKLLENAANAVYWSLRAQGVDLAELKPDDAKARLFGALFQDATPLGMKHTVELAQAHAEHGLLLGEHLPYLYKDARDRQSLTPAADAFNPEHPLLKTLNKSYANDLEKINAKYSHIMQQGARQ